MKTHGSSDFASQSGLRPADIRRDRRSRPTVWGATAIIILGAVIAAWFIWPETKREEDTASTAKPTRIKEVKLVAASKKTAPVDTVNDDKPKKRMYLGSEVVKVETFTNAGVVVERLYTADGKRHRLNHTPPSIFKHASDEYLGIILSTPPGLPMAPLPDLSHDGNIEKAFLESLADEIKINDTDSDEVKDIKAKVIAARESMDAQLRQGIGFAEVLENERKIHNENVSVRSQVSAEYHNLLKTASPDDAETYRTKINAVLRNMGIEELEQKQKK